MLDKDDQSVKSTAANDNQDNGQQDRLYTVYSHYTANLSNISLSSDESLNLISKRPYSSNRNVQATIEALLTLGCPPIPVAPKQDPKLDGCHNVTRIEVWAKPSDPPAIQGNYCRISSTSVDKAKAHVKGDYCGLDKDLQPIIRFTGKNPSYLDGSGKARILTHGEFQKRFPTDADLYKWFCHPSTGVGTLGRFNGINWLDFDAKHYPTQEACDQDVQRIISTHGLENTWIERTGSGGYRIAVKPEQYPTFTNFDTDPSGDRHIGEAIWEGRYTVLAPTIHPNGKPYKRISFGEPLTVPSLEAIGIYPTKDEQQNQARKNQDIENSDPNLNPWDMRNLADYITGYRVEKDWIKCKCPAHDGTSDNSLHINVDSGGFRCWAGCNNKAVFAAVKEVAVKLGYEPTQEQIAAYEETRKIKQEVVNAAVAAAETKLLKIAAQLLEVQASIPKLKAAHEQARVKYNSISHKKEDAESKASAKAARDEAEKEWKRGRDTTAQLQADLAEQKKEHQKALDAVSDAAKAAYYVKVRAWQKQANTLDLKPTHTTPDRFERGVLANEPGLILVDGRMGQGKTSRQIKGFRDCQAERYPCSKVIMLVPRNVLGRANVIALNGVYHEAFDNPALLNDQTWLAMAYDSLWKIDISKITEGSLLIIDEVTAGFLHLLLSGTLSRDGKRILAIKRFEAIVRRVYAMGGWVIASVDGLTNPEINYLHKLMGKDVPYIFNKSTAKPKPVDIKIVPDSASILEKGVQQLTRHPNEPIAFIADSQEEISRFVLHVIENGILTEDQIAIFDSKTSAEPWAQAAVEGGLDNYIEDKKPLLFAFTPTLENGVSIEAAIEGTRTATNLMGDAYFKHRFCYLSGVLSSRSGKQMLFRLRHDIPTTMWIADKGHSHPLSKGLLPEEVLADLKANAGSVADYTYLQETREERLAGEKKAYEEGVLNTLALLGEQANAELFAVAMSHKKFDGDKALAPVYTLLCELIARENWDKLNLKTNLIALFREAGHNVIMDESEACKEFKLQRKELSVKLLTIEANEFAFTDDIVLSDGTPLDPDTAQKILDDHKANKVDRIKAMKCIRREKLPIPHELDRMELVTEDGETKTVRMLDHPGFVRNWIRDGKENEALKDLRNFWAVMNPELQQQADTAKVNKLFTNAALKADPSLRSVFAADVKVDGVKAKFLSDSPFPDAFRAIAAGGCYTSKAECLEPLKTWGVENADELYRRWRITVKESQAPGTVFNSLCRALGVELESDSVKVNKNLETDSSLGLLNISMTNLSLKQWSPGVTVRVYRLANLDAPDRVALLAAFDNKAAKHSEVKDWINTLPLLAQVEMYQAVREGKVGSYIDTYETYRRDRSFAEPMNAVQRMWFKKTLLDSTSRYFAESGKLEATEFNVLVSDLERMSREIYEAVPFEDVEIAF